MPPRSERLQSSAPPLSLYPFNYKKPQKHSFKEILTYEQREASISVVAVVL